MALYHADVFLPKRVRNMVVAGKHTLAYSQHAMRESTSDRYGKLSLPVSIVVGPSDIVEIEEYSGTVRKYVIRVPLNDRLDLCLAVIPEGKGRLFVKTVWANEVNDTHKTLDLRRYERRI